MAEFVPKAGGVEMATENTVLQPAEPLPINESDGGKEETEQKETVDGQTGESSAVDASADTSPKGKDKDEPPPVVGKAREGDSLSIGPPDLPPPALAGDDTAAPVCAITLLLPTGARHPYRIDEKYLSKRNVEVPEVTESGGRDPFSISIYKLKELILREWREEWDGKPASPSSIRLIHFGKLLDDKEQLKKYQFSQDSPNVVHMSVRPPEMMEEEETAKSKAHSREGRSRDGGSGCCVIL
ncbi:hypothetical protein CHGG_03775 [Chaetomium globosum CBS 148.51]|uniref:UBL3-like ubiquitin domain-containing protein n=1 Tax=Chaetomium globosum (strain ATCC 6205 / CBS 148.51 / DSM 1962 / NBRC 6347 / NRRL 1970) TaxID=306901 RepID=Q2H371_CHAGB|nr:uncharacterized protein CHGG_03775 [Chaetomium globosum CBS 148.51]EAQ87156.1 hypothetical protein CHGG_03775 [Chaetomium globosum CBS 148.51]